tara:strand:+ start:11495 stop:12670 length:1176 start_codon:yes stop_codon:yes gene_type:complete
MKKKIAILGSTGSIGLTTLKIISENKKLFEVNLLSTNKNIKILKKQIKFFKVKNVIIHDRLKYIENREFFKKKKINLYQNISDYKKMNKKKFDYVMSSIVGLNGLKPTMDIIGCTKRIAIANKESIICGWNLIIKELKKNNTKFIPIDSEHFSIFELIKNEKPNNIKKIYITASGGPFLNTKITKLNKFNPKNAVKHPTWKMGKKISIDSSTLINKIFELIEAKKIFNLSYDKFEIIIQPTSYIHGIVEFNNGFSKILSHPTSMKIPIYNSLLFNEKIFELRENFDISKMNNLNFQKIDKKKFPILKLLKHFTNFDSLFETIFVTANDVLVDLFLTKKIKFYDIYKILDRVLSLKEYKRYKKLMPQNLNQINKLSDNVRLKTLSLSVQSKV